MKKVAEILALIGIILIIAGLIINFLFPNGEKCKVSFDSNGGSDLEAVYVVKGRPLSQPNNPIREGYVFLGWYYDGALYNFTSIVEYDFVLTASWIKVN